MERPTKNKILVVGTDGLSTRLLVSAIQKEWDLKGFVLEQSISPWSIAKGRARKIGWIKTLGQVFFLKLILPFIGGKKRKLELCAQVEFPKEQLNPIQIKSINDGSLMKIVQELKPDYILLSGCRIISKEILEQIAIPILNVHAGITPKYRGVHGGYWALKNGDKANFGVTLHRVDTGIDTGSVIGQRVLEPSDEDTFKTYPILQLIAGIALLNEVKAQLWAGEIPLKTPLTKESNLFYHPTWIQYLAGRIGKGVR